MFCPKCGIELNDAARFCTVCGAPIRRTDIDDSNQAGIANGGSKEIKPKRELATLLPMLGIATCAALFFIGVIALCFGFADNITELVTLVAGEEEVVVAATALLFAILLLIPGVLLLFNFENCVDWLAHRKYWQEKYSMVIARTIVAIAVLLILTLLPLFIDLLPLGGADMSEVVTALSQALANASVVCCILSIVATGALFFTRRISSHCLENADVR